ncbi:GntR family transcriptional regulator [Glutamicibacter sp. MNS18]|uniref:GntR family transcriptional regulator n=1 Tax=Glutamicibacter sp. MNS18 TaxID=2989817 RepID=UPI00223583D3|nr:GntR family transcriptional regulator [Glutamicibacter sp. MNS18]MCW4466694.1 GntR family transcriptional regulator [Glutamicibacter sp. MNS18]
MNSNVTVDLLSAVPPYEQIRTQIATLIRVGELADGSRLPTVRALAIDLGVAAGTVARAYKELESSGLVVSRRRAGTMVTAPQSATEQHGELVQAVDQLLVLARAEAVDLPTLITLLQRRAGR